jgi:hypothetical protein
MPVQDLAIKYVAQDGAKSRPQAEDDQKAA